MVIENNSTQTRQELFIKLYETVFPKVAAFIKKKSGTFEEAKDVFQDALIIYYEKTRKNDFTVQTDERSYLMGICKNLWYKKHNENKLEQRSDLMFDLRSEEKEQIISEHILRFVEQSGKKCLDLLQSFYYDKLNMKEIADKFNFSGERSATAQKYKCLEKIRKVIKDKSLNKEDFYE